MFRKRSKFAVGAVLTLAMCSSAAGAYAASPGLSAEPKSAIVASQAFASAAGPEALRGAAEPAAVPAVVATAFVSGAAGAAGAKVGGWVADKVTGIWSLPGEAMDDSIFD